MAEFRTWSQFDLRNVDFNANFVSGYASHYFNNENSTVNGVVYEDVLQVDHTAEPVTASEDYYGSAITVSVGGDVTGGKITAYYNWFVNDTDGLWYYNIEVRGFSVSAVDFYNAQLSVSRLDDSQILSQILAGNDRIELKSAGADYMEGRGGNDTLLGGGGGDTLLGGSGRDVIQGQAGNDSLIGGLGTDRLIGGAGNHTLTGGTGAVRDTFVFANGVGTDHVTDFQDGLDRIEITSGASKFGNLHLSTHGGNVWVQFGTTIIIVEHMTVPHLTVADFTFT